MIKNPQKLKKAELIRLVKKNDSTVWGSFLTFLLTWKKWILSITLITILIKSLRKYTIISSILRFINWIILSIFGISLIDQFGLIEIFRHVYQESRFILSTVVGYLSGTTFYSYLTNIFKSQEIVSTPSKISLRDEPTEIHSNNSRNESQIRQNQKNNTIAEWLKPEIKQEESSYSKYYLILILLILAFLSWYYLDELKPTGFTVLEWLRTWSHKDLSPNNVLNKTIELKDWVKTKFSKRDDDSNSSSDVGSPDYKDYFKSPQISAKSIELIDTKDQASSVLDKKTLMKQYTGISDINRDNFLKVSEQIPIEIDTYLSKFTENDFPNEDLKTGLYNVIKSRLKKLQQVDPERFEIFSNDAEINKKLYDFRALEDSVIPQYKEVETASNNEQKAWSEASNPASPKIDKGKAKEIDPFKERSISPEMFEYSEETVQKMLPNSENLLDSIKKRREEMHEDSDIDSWIDNPENQAWLLIKIMESETQFAKEILEAIKENNYKINQKAKELMSQGWIDRFKIPEISIESNSTNSSLEHYLPEATPNIESKIKNYWNKIKNFTSSNPDTPTISKIGLSPLKEAPTIDKLQESIIERDSKIPSGIDTTKEAHEILHPKYMEKIETLKKRLTPEEVQKFDDMLAKSDLNRLEKIVENRTISDIRESITQNYTIDKLKKHIESNTVKSEDINRDPMIELETNIETMSDKEIVDNIKENFKDMEGFEEGVKQVMINNLKLENLLSDEDKNEIEKIVNDNRDKTSVELIEAIKEKYPDYDEKSYRDSFRKMTELVLNEAIDEDERKKWLREIMETDLEELNKIKNVGSISDIKNALNENYTRNSMIEEIKHKTSRLFEEAEGSSSTITQILTETMNLFDDSNIDVGEHTVTTEIDWNSPEVKLIESEKTIVLDFGNIKNEIESIIIRTNDNYFSNINIQERKIDLSGNNIKLDWGHEFNTLDSLGIETKVYEVSITDKKGVNHLIYQNNLVEKLK